MAPSKMPPEHRRQGGLIDSRRLDVTGRIVAPGERHGQSARIWITPFGPDLTFGPDGLQEVGHCHPGSADRGTDFEASLLLPQDALPGVITGLASVWKYLHLWTATAPDDRATVTDFAFSATIPDSL